MAGGKRTHKIQVNLGEVSRRNRNSRHRNMNVGLAFASLAKGTGTCPETHVPGQPKPKEPGGEKSLRGTDLGVREHVK